jgi:hypothetical protein
MRLFKVTDYNQLSALQADDDLIGCTKPPQRMRVALGVDKDGLEILFMVSEHRAVGDEVHLLGRVGTHCVYCRPDGRGFVAVRFEPADGFGLSLVYGRDMSDVLNEVTRMVAKKTTKQLLDRTRAVPA